MTLQSSPGVLGLVRNPDEYFAGPLGYRQALVPLLLASVIGVLLAQAMRPFVLHALLASVPPEAADRMAQFAEGSVFRFGALGAAVMPLVRAGVAAVLAFLVLGAFFRTPRIASVVTCAAWASLALSAKEFAKYAVLRADGLESLRGPQDLAAGVGLGFLLDERQGPLFTLLEAANGFDALYLYLFTATLARAHAVPVREALAAALVPWLLLQGVNVGFSALFVS